MPGAELRPAGFGAPEFDSLEQRRDWSDAAVIGEVVGVVGADDHTEVAGVPVATAIYRVRVLDVIGGQHWPVVAEGAGRDPVIEIEVPMVAGPSEDGHELEELRRSSLDGTYLLFLRLPPDPEGLSLAVESGEFGGEVGRSRRYVLNGLQDALYLMDRDGNFRSFATGPSDEREVSETYGQDIARYMGEPFVDVVEGLRGEVGTVVTDTPFAEPDLDTEERDALVLAPPDPQWPVVRTD